MSHQKGPKRENRYQKMVGWIFLRHYKHGDTHVEWHRDEINEAADALGLERVKNLGDAVYSFRFRTVLPAVMLDAAPDGYEWVIRGNKKSQYAFDLIPAQVRIVPRSDLAVIKVPDSTPEIITASALGDEQALLAVVRYNRLIDIFLGVTAYSLQNHLRTTTKNIGQVEIDEIYVAVDRYGRQFIIPVQAKGGKDQIGITQTEQDLDVCQEKWPHMIPRAVSAQFGDDGRIAMFELTVQEDQVRVHRESHYRLVPASEITSSNLNEYWKMAPGIDD